MIDTSAQPKADAKVDAVTGIVGAEAKDAPAPSAGAESEAKDIPAPSAKGAGIEPMAMDDTTEQPDVGTHGAGIEDGEDEVMWPSEGEGEGDSDYSWVSASANAVGDQMTAEDEAQRQVQRLSRGPEVEGPEGLGGEGLDDSTEEREESGVHEAGEAPRLNCRQLEARYRALRESRRRARIIRGRSQEIPVFDGAHWVLEGPVPAGQLRRFHRREDDARGARSDSANVTTGLSDRRVAMARGELYELGGNQGNDAAISDDGAGGAAAGTSRRAEARPPIEEIDPVLWASWSYGQRRHYRRRQLMGGNKVDRDHRS